MEIYIKMNKQNRKKTIQIETQRCIEALSTCQSHPTQFIARAYELLEKRPLKIISASVHITFIKNKGFGAALSQFPNFPEFIYSIDSHRQLFLLTEESLIPSNSDTFNSSWYWVIVLLNNVQLLLELMKAVMSLKQPELEKKTVFSFKSILSKNMGIVEFTKRIQLIPLGIHFPELRYLIKVLVSLLVRETALITPLMDLSTVKFIAKL